MIETEKNEINQWILFVLSWVHYDVNCVQFKLLSMSKCGSDKWLLNSMNIHNFENDGTFITRTYNSLLFYMIYKSLHANLKKKVVETM